MKFRYLNTDLDLKSPVDVRPLTRALTRFGMWVLHEDKRAARGSWFACLAMEAQFRNPNSNISAILSAIEKLPPKARMIWSGCTLREFNIGYDCGEKPWAFNQALSNRTLSRLAAVGATLRITLYPLRPHDPENLR